MIQLSLSLQQRRPRRRRVAPNSHVLLLSLLLLCIVAANPCFAWRFPFLFPNKNTENNHPDHDSVPVEELPTTTTKTTTTTKPEGDNNNFKTETSPLGQDQKKTTKNSVPLETLLPTPSIDVITTAKVVLVSARDVIQGLWSFLHENARAITLYNPPVGLAYVLATIRLVRMINVNRNLDIQPKQFYKKHHRRHGGQRRAFVLDGDDTEYDEFGGVEHVRRQLCQVAASNPDDADDGKNNNNVIRIALDVTVQPNESRLQFIYELIPHVARLMTMDQASLSASSSSSTKDSTPRTSVDTTGLQNTLQSIASVTCQVRLTDAILRLCRDRLLQTSYNLARTVEKFEQRTKISRNLAFLWQMNVLRTSMEEDRLRLCIAQAAYESEIHRLGVITDMLMQRPVQLQQQQQQPPLGSTSSSSTSTNRALIDAVRSTERRRQRRRQQGSMQEASGPSSSSHSATSTEKYPKFLNPLRRLSTRALFSKYSFRWKLDGRGIVSIRKFDDIGSSIDTIGAVEALRALDSDKWTQSAKEWIQQSRRILCQTIQGILQDSTESSTTSNNGDMENEGEAANFARLAQQWCRSNASWEKGHDEELYLRQIVDYVDRSASWQRVGEGQRIRLRDILGVLEYGKRWDVWGIPSTLAILYVAGVIHERIFRPYWPRIKVELIDLWKKTVEILDQRVWVPVKGAL